MCISFNLSTFIRHQCINYRVSSLNFENISSQSKSYMICFTNGMVCSWVSFTRVNLLSSTTSVSTPNARRRPSILAPILRSLSFDSSDLSPPEALIKVDEAQQSLLTEYFLSETKSMDVLVDTLLHVAACLFLRIPPTVRTFVYYFHPLVITAFYRSSSVDAISNHTRTLLSMLRTTIKSQGGLRVRSFFKARTLLVGRKHFV